MSKLARDHRNSDLAKIHLAKKQLAMSDEDYRDMLWTQGRVRSSKDLDHVGRANVLEYLKKIGFKTIAKPGGKRPRRPVPPADKLKLIRRIRAQLISLDRKPDTYADGIAKQMFGEQAPDFYEWCNHDQLHRLSAALGVQQRREGAATQ
ncbi:MULTISPECIES: regulatory protein GemA [unclassified Variovorax]|jgi:phage gp16-like protein|nr:MULTISPECIES: regulatory protein GemA [unclassified Variovorax]